jgi:heme a synthase
LNLGQAAAAGQGRSGLLFVAAIHILFSPMSRSVNNPWLHRSALLTAGATLALLALGGLVTSHEAGMSVPDWPNSYGYNMFAFPISKWAGGIFYEHTHRLLATIVGTLTVILTRWLGGRRACIPLLTIGALEIIAGVALNMVKPELKGAGFFLSGIGSVVVLAGAVWVRNEPAPGFLISLGWIAFVLVQLQGLLGGLRVVLIEDWIGIFHAALAQMFFALLCAIALFSSRWWAKLSDVAPLPDRKGLRALLLATTLIIFGQLVLGATMRHQHAGLAIPDFPLAYHKIWPAMDADSVASYNAHRLEVTEGNPIAAFQIGLQMAHRLAALFIFCAVMVCVRTTRRRLGADHPLSKLSLAWLGVIAVQILLGAVTIWSNKAADIATAHVVVGALSLVTGALLTIISFRVLIPVCVMVVPTAEPVSTPVLAGKTAATNAK